MINERGWWVRDDSGKLSAPELQAALKSIGHDIPLDQVKKIVASIDKSGDGQIDINEETEADAVLEELGGLSAPLRKQNGGRVHELRHGAFPLAGNSSGALSSIAGSSRSSSATIAAMASRSSARRVRNVRHSFADGGSLATRPPREAAMDSGSSGSHRQDLSISLEKTSSSYIPERLLFIAGRLRRRRRRDEDATSS
ncbi:unnamed protein product [Lampetra fluviatilis]